MTKKVKKMAFGGLNSAPIKTALTVGSPAPVTPTTPLRQAPAPAAPIKTSLGGGKPAPVNPANINPIRTPGGGLPAPGTGGRPPIGGVRGPLPQATNPVRPIGGQARPPAGNPAMMKKGGSVKSSASKRADGIATKGKTKGRIV